MNIRETKDGAIITVFVKPNAPKFQIIVDGDEIVVHSTEEPVRGRVNKQILKEFSKLLQTEIELVSGATARQKMLLAKGLGKGEVERLLCSKVQDRFL